jgi:putative transcriptional regulator
LLITLVAELKNSKMNRIKQIIEEKGVKQIWLAEQLGKSYNMVNSYVQNRRQPSIEDLYRIGKILNIEAKELLIESLENKK